MGMRPVLSVDTAYDPDSAWFASGRALLYNRVGTQFNIVTFDRFSAERRRVLRYIERAEAAGNPFRAIVVSSHGKPSRVLDDDSPDGILISAESPDTELDLWARGRTLYFCCCETGNGPLFDKLLERGAVTVVGFTGRPSALTGDGKFFWREFDQDLVACALHDQRASGFERARQQFLERIAGKISGLSDGPIRDDLRNMMDVLATMIIRDGEGS